MERVLVIAGPTAAGKTSLAIEVADQLGGEIISADAFAVYRGMDIGTDKPDAEQRRRIPHHLVDIVEPTQRFSAGDFVRAADAAVASIVGRGRIPVIAGGSHFYLHALLHGLFPSPPHDPAVRSRLVAAWAENPAHIYARLQDIDPESARRIGPTDRQRILRALEIWETTGTPMTEHWRRHRAERRYAALAAAPQRPRDQLYARIDARVETMFSAGLVGEVRRLLEIGVPRTAHALRAIGYRQVVEHLETGSLLEDAIAATQTASRRLAKRQLSWLRRDEIQPVHWIDVTSESSDAAEARVPTGVHEIIGLWSDVGGVVA